MVTEPAAVTTFPMALVWSSPAEDGAGLLCAPAGPGRTTLADSITPSDTARTCVRIGFHSLKVRVFINTLERMEQRGLVFRELRRFSQYRQVSQILRAEKCLNRQLKTVACSTIDFG